MSADAARNQVSDTLDVQRHSRRARLIVLAALALIASLWIPWYLALAWWLGLVALTGKFSDALMEAAAASWGARHPRLISFALAAWAGVCSVAYNAIWWTVWLREPEAGVVLGCVCICMLMLNAANYMTNLRFAFINYLAPGLLALGLLPTLTGAGGATMWLGPSSAVILAMIGVVFYVDREAMVKRVARQELLRLHAVEENNAKTEFLNTMTHELRTPLNIIIGSAELLEEELKSAEHELAADADRIVRAARQLQKLVDATIDFSALEQGSFKLNVLIVDLDGLVRSLAQQGLMLAAKNNNRFEYAIGGDLGAALLDGRRLRQVLAELIDNACKFTSAGNIELRAEKESVGAGPILRVTISDTGPGMNGAQVACLFRQFVQVDGSVTRVHGGAGLGLALCHRLIEQMRGTIQCKTAQGAGATFVVEVPLSERDVD